jgi:hypothetical protein
MLESALVDVRSFHGRPGCSSPIVKVVRESIPDSAVGELQVESAERLRQFKNFRLALMAESAPESIPRSCTTREGTPVVAESAPELVEFVAPSHGSAVGVVPSLVSLILTLAQVTHGSP